MINPSALQPWARGQFAWTVFQLEPYFNGLVELSGIKYYRPKPHAVDVCQQVEELRPSYGFGCDAIDIDQQVMS